MVTSKISVYVQYANVTVLFKYACSLMKIYSMTSRYNIVFVSTPTVPKCQIKKLLLMNILVRYTVAVSYTHLDVYKRQTVKKRVERKTVHFSVDSVEGILLYDCELYNCYITTETVEY